MPHKLRLNKSERKLLSTSWRSIAGESDNNERVLTAISSAWLSATEQSPTWVWGVISVSESVEGGAEQHPKFKTLVQQISTFIGHSINLIHNHKDSRFAGACQQLGLRHRHYFIEGHRPAYWGVFCRELKSALNKLVSEYAEEHGQSFEDSHTAIAEEEPASSISAKPSMVRDDSSSGDVPTQSKPRGSISSHNLSADAAGPIKERARAKSMSRHDHLMIPSAASYNHNGAEAHSSSRSLGKHGRQDKLMHIWSNFLDAFFEHIHMGYCGNCAKPGGSVGASLMNMLSMSGMMSSSNTLAQQKPSAIATIMKPNVPLRQQITMTRQGTI